MAARDPQGPRQVPPWWTEDPTKNVERLVEAERRRQDDLREMTARHAEQTAALRAEHDKELRKIRDESVSRAADVATATAKALAEQLVATAAAQVTSLAAALVPIQNDLRELREAQARGQGGKEQTAETREVRAETRQGRDFNLTSVSVLIGAIVLALALYATFHH